ncbi:MAG: glycosyltransferase family 2 protein [Cycloclasticus sp.]
MNIKAKSIPEITVVIPSYNQSNYLGSAINSVLLQDLAVELIVMDGGSIDGSMSVLEKYKNELTYWQSEKDSGQAAAINNGMKYGSAPYVCWLNSDDLFLPGGLRALLNAIKEDDKAPFVYGNVFTDSEFSGSREPTAVEKFDENRLANKCIISQPGTLIRRSAWEALDGLDAQYHMSMDYDLWWRLYKNFSSPRYISDFVAVNRDHQSTKTRNNRREHYRDSMQVVKKHYGSIPIRWWLAQPYSVWYKAFLQKVRVFFTSNG